jgi:hypothetical protein
MGGHRRAEMCSLRRKKGVIASPSTSLSTHFLVPSFSSNGGRFDVGVRLEEKEPNLEPRDQEARDIIYRETEKTNKSRNFEEKRARKFKRRKNEKSKNNFCISNRPKMRTRISSSVRVFRRNVCHLGTPQ